MALNEESGNGLVMPVAPMYGGNGGGNAFGGDTLWFLVLFILLGGWNGGFGGFGGGYAMNELYPWMNQSNQMSNGFRDQMMNTQINGIQGAITGGFGDVQNSLCAGFAGVNATVNGAQNALAQQLYSNQITDLERSFAAQTANTAAMNALQSQFASCCCENRMATADTKYTIATEACANRSVVNDALRDVIAANNASTQRILDQMCQDKIDAKNEKIAELQNALTMANIAANQNANTAAILANNEAQTAALEQYLAPVPKPAYVVQNPACCNQTFGCGCAA